MSGATVLAGLTFPTSDGSSGQFITTNGLGAVTGVEIQAASVGSGYTFATINDADINTAAGSGSISGDGILFTNIVGDINADGYVDILDVINLVNFILNADTPTTIEFLAADQNGDGILNVLDIVLLVDGILSTS